MSNYNEYIRREYVAKKRLTEAFGEITDNSGIYVLTREEEGIKYAYVGQAVHIFTRLAQHLMGYQHIDLSIKKHGLWSPHNPTGWALAQIILVPEEHLDAAERAWIASYANWGYQLRNKTLGGQDEGKSGLDNSKPPKGYYDGVEQGEKKTLKKIAIFFDKYLDVVVKGDVNKIKERKLAEFKELLKGVDE